MRHILICALASTAIGTGHVRRMTTLIAALQPLRPGRISLLTTPLGAQIARTVDCGDLNLITVDVTDPRDISPVLFSNAQPDILILDNYHWTATTEAPLKDTCGALVIVDDLADRAHTADLLLDQNAHHAEADYRTLVSEHCTLAVGADYCMISAPFLAEKRAHFPDAITRARINRVFVSLGGGDPGDQLLRLTGLLLDVVPDGISVATGSHIAQATALKALARANPERLEVVLDSPRVAQQMNACGWAVSAGGTMTWERAVLGLPSVSLVLADNQEKAAKWLDQKGIQISFDLRNDWRDDDFCKTVAGYQADFDRRIEQAKSALALIDGKGAARVAQRIMDLPV